MPNPGERPAKFIKDLIQKSQFNAHGLVAPTACLVSGIEGRLPSNYAQFAALQQTKP
jgi:hypothetical protein